jgi:hypothetical protein
MCLLDEDNVFDAVTTHDATKTTKVFLRGVAEGGNPAPLVGVTAATLENKALTIEADGKMEVTFPNVLTYKLRLVIVGPQVGDKVELCEACDSGTIKPLTFRRVQQDTTGGINPLLTFQVNAT